MVVELVLARLALGRSSRAPWGHAQRANHPFWYLSGTYFCRAIMGRSLGVNVRESPKAALTRREREVAALVAEGLTNRDIATRLFISERTVDGHLEHIREKLGVSSRAQVATWYVAQPPPGTEVPAGSSGPRPRSRRSTLLVAAASLTVLALAAVIGWQRLVASQTSSSPSMETFAPVSPEEQIKRPLSVAVGSDGLIYVADSNNFAIKRIDLKQRTIATFAGGHSDQFVEGSDALSASIGNPTSVAVTPTGVVFFANGSMVGRIDTDGKVHAVASGPMLEPFGLAYAGGALYIADREGNRVWLRSPDGALSLFAGTGEEGFQGDGAAALAAELDHPRDVAIDAAGNLLIVDTGNNRIRRVDRASNVITTVAGSGDVYGLAGDGGPADHAKLSLPWGVAVGPDGSIYIADTGNNRLRRVRAAIITTVAAAKDGLNGPAGVAVSGSGDVYVVDAGDNRFYVVPRDVAR
jgi:DNA-binding CsgD family transcriptional regulator/DNA-binding beta-propeller fold protein YncE